MHYFLRQIFPPDCDPEPPIEIHLYTNSVNVGRQQLKSLTKFRQISRNHAAFYKSDDGNLFVSDLGSRNGVYVNGTRIGSYLKQLNSGDVIGFGVASSGAAGFVCVLCTEDIDIEELEITDEEEVEITDEEEVEITDDDKSSKKSNSKTSVQRESGLNTTQVASHNNNNNVYLPDIYELPSVSKHQNRTKNTQRKVERGESSSHAKDGVTCYDNNNSNQSESSGITSVSLPQKDVQGEPTLQDCLIHLLRCDDSSFQFAPDVKNPFKTGQIKLPLQRTKLTKRRDYSGNIKRISHRKRSGILNTDSSDDSDEYIPESATTDSSEDSDENIRVSAQSKAQRTRYLVNNKHRRKLYRKLSTDSSDDFEKYIRQISRSRAQHTTYSFNNKHRRKQSRKSSTDSSDVSDKYIRQSAPTKVRHTTYSVNNKHQRKQSRKLSTDSSDDFEYILQRTLSKARRTTDLLSNKRPRQRPQKISSDSSGDSDKNVDLVSNKRERKRPRNSSSVSSDDSGKILYARTSSNTRLNADALTSDKNGHDCRTNSANQVSGRKGTLPRGPDLEELNCKLSSSKTEDNLKAKAKISFGSQDDGAGLRYSQAEKFYISDDETDLDMKSSMDCALVKQKTKDTGDSNSESDTCKEIFGRENSYSPTPNTAVREGHSDDRTESIEAILAFIKGTKNSKPDSRPAPRDSVVQINRSIFPLPSRNTDGEQSPEYHSDALTRSKDKTNGDASSEVRNSAGGERISLLTEHKGIRKSAGRTLFTEPKPLTHIARRFRGRDENFVERKKPQIVSPRAEKPSGNGTPRSDSKNSKFNDYTPPPPAKKRVSHFASKASTSKSSGPNLAPNDSSPPSQPSSLVDVVEKNRVGIERTESSRGHAATRLPPAKNAATDHKRSTVAATLGDHQRLPARLEGSNGVLRQLLPMNTRWLQDEVRNSAGGERISLLTEHNGIRKSAGRALFTEPKLLTHIARRFRGRDENFVERKKPQTVPPRAEKPSGDGTPRSDSKNSKFNDYTPPPPAKKRVSHFASKASTSKSSDPNLAPNDSSPPSQPSPLVDVVEKNRVGIERTESSRGHAATDHQRSTVAATVGDHQRLPARLEGSNGVLRQLLQMNTRWLQEQAANRKPPPDVSRGAARLPASFDSHESYVAMFRPLIILEIWERLYAGWREVETDVGQNCKFHFAVLGHTERGGCVELECESVSADGRNGPREGDVAVLEVKEGPPHNQCTPLFGYIPGHNVELLAPDYVLGDTPWKHMPEDWRSGGDVPKRWTFRACVKRKRETPSFNQQSLMRGYNLSCVRNLLSWADAFSSIRDSPLLDNLLRPATYALPTSQSQSPFDKENLFYTCEQEAFIRRVCDTVARRAKDPEVFLLSGSPGTGKTHVIVGLMERLLYHQGAGDIRVVVAAPGDTAVDEIECRLVRLARRYSGNAVRFVRLGHERQVDRQMVPYCVTKVLRGVSVDEAEVLRRSHVVLSTLSGLRAAHQLRPSLCIVDDASQCTEPDALQAVATGAPLLVLAGDIYQRAPRVLSRMARYYGLCRSLFERMMLSRPAHALSEQFRMHPDIARFPCPSSFPSPLRPIDISHLRPYLVLDLPDDEDTLPVAVVCEFLCSVDSRAAVAALVAPSSRRSRFRADASQILSRHAGRVEVCDPDGFLGREKDVVVLWAALACPMRLYAALTRARRCLIMCVAGQVVRANPLWANLLADAEERGVLYSAPLTPDYLKRMLRRLLLVKPR